MATSKSETDVVAIQAVPRDQSGDASASSAEGDGDIASEAIGTGNLPPGYYRSLSFIMTMVAIALMNISLYTGYVLPVNVLSIINEDIGPSENYLLIPVTKTLGQGIAILLCLGTIGAIIGATSTSINVLMGATAFIGVAGAVQLSFSFVVQELVPNKYRGVVVAVQFIISFPFACFGPVMARSLVINTSLGWRWCYLLNTITCATSVILFFFFYHPPSYGLLNQGKSLRRELWRLDYGGLILYCGGILMLLLGISWGGTVHPWASGEVIGCLIAGIVSIGLFAVYEIYLPFKNVHPLVPMRAIKSRSFVALAVTGSVATTVYNSMNVLWPQMVATLFTTDILEVGWYSAALGGSVAIGQICAGLTIRPFGRPMKAHWQLRVSAAGMASFVAGLAAVTVDRGGLAIALMALAGFCVGYVELLALVLVPFTCAPRDIGLASGFQSSCRGIMGSVATALYGTVLGNRNAVNVPAAIRTYAVPAGLPAGEVGAAVEAVAAGSFAGLKGVTPKVEAVILYAVKVGNAMSFRTMFLVSLAFGLSSVLGSLFVGNLDRFLTDEVARKLQGVKGDPAVREKDEAV